MIGDDHKWRNGVYVGRKVSDHGYHPGVRELGF